MKSPCDLKNKTAVITGGAGLIGSALTEGLAAAGGNVYIAESDIHRAQQLEKRLKKKRLRVQSIPLDIGDELSIDKCISKILAERGSIDIWINNAYPRTGDWGSKLEAVKPESWRKNIDQHLNGYCFCAQKIAEKMKAKKKGSIINMGSIYGIVAPDFNLYTGTQMTMPAAYSVIKSGILHFTRYLASYYGPFGLRVNSISPGGVFDHQPKIFVKRYTEKTPLKRMAHPQDMAGAALFLASDASAYITGHNLVVDGGWSIV